MSKRQVFFGSPTIDVSGDELRVTLETSRTELRAILQTAANQADRDGLPHTAARLRADVDLIEHLCFQLDVETSIRVLS